MDKNRKTRLHGLLISIACALPCLLDLPAFAQPSEECGESCFSTRVVSVERDGDCAAYELEVYVQGSCRYELSHFNVQPPCGVTGNAWNSEGWAMELNATDPTTGLRGLKVDNIGNFGKDPKKSSFRVRFILCSDDDCTGPAGCGEFRLAYKAATCVYYQELSVACSEPIEVTEEAIQPGCAGAGNGTIRLNISGGTEPYTVEWGHGATGAGLTGLSAGSYTYLVRDETGTELRGDVELSEPEPLAIGESVQQPACSGSNSGSISATVTGGTAPYQYRWEHGGTEPMIGNLPPGTYQLEVTDAQGCQISETFVLAASQTITISGTIVRPSCDGSHAGSIELSLSGGTAPYTFNWSNGSDSQNIYGLTEGYYTVSVQDANGCSAGRTFSIKTDNTLSASARITNTNCFNDPIGAIDLSINGDTAPYTVEWAHGPQSEDISGLEAGKYTATIRDAAGCSLQYSGYVRENQLFVYPVSVQPPSCPGSDDGAIDLTVYYGQEPYTYLWSTGAEAEDLEGLAAGSYTVTVTDANGCSASRTVTLNDPEPVAAVITVSGVSCTPAVSYDLTASATGGSGEYSYLWSTGEITGSLKGVAEGSYSVTITDSRGCSTETQAEISQQAYPCPENEEDPGDEGDPGDDQNTGDDEGSDETGNNDTGDGSGDESGGDEGTPADGGGNTEPDDDTGSGDGADEGQNDDGIPPSTGGDCADCFYSDPVTIVQEGDAYRLNITIGHGDNCRHDLSHVTIALPGCATIVQYSNSEGWAMEIVGKDPTTGISGIKVDNISSFGKAYPTETFTVSLLLKAPDSQCAELLACYSPVYAFKAATCVHYEQGQATCAGTTALPGFYLYPNPAQDQVTVALEDAGKFSGQIELLNSMGYPLIVRTWQSGVGKAL
jgi:hypothetical protein